MTTYENINVIIHNTTGINMVGLNAYNLAICTEPYDGANMTYVSFKNYNLFSNIGFGAQFYQGTDLNYNLFRDIPTTIFNTFDTNTNLYLNSNMFYTPYPRYFTDRTTLGMGTALDGASSYLSSVLAPNGKIYCPPAQQTAILIFDPNTNSIDNTSVPVVSTLTNEWSSSMLAPNGKIYCPPGTSTRVLIIDPMLNTIDTTTITIPGLTSAIKWSGSCITPGGLFTQFHTRKQEF